MALVYLTSHVHLYISIFILQNILNSQSIILYFLYMEEWEQLTITEKIFHISCEDKIIRECEKYQLLLNFSKVQTVVKS